MNKKKRLDEKIVNMKRLMLINENDEQIPYAEEVPEPGEVQMQQLGQKLLGELKNEYKTAMVYIDGEANKVMAGTSLIELVKDENVAKSKEHELESKHEYYEKRHDYFDDQLDDLKDKLGYNNPLVQEIGKYTNGLYYLAKDMWDAAQVWYKLNQVAQEILEKVGDNPKSRQTLINLKTTQI